MLFATFDINTQTTKNSSSIVYKQLCLTCCLPCSSDTRGPAGGLRPTRARCARFYKVISIIIYNNSTTNSLIKTVSILLSITIIVLQTEIAHERQQSSRNIAELHFNVEIEEKRGSGEALLARGRACGRSARATRLRTNGVDTSGAAAEVTHFDRLGKRSALALLGR